MLSRPPLLSEIGQPKPKLKLTGVRRIWGTLKSSSNTAVASVLGKCTTLGTKLAVKRKFKSSDTGKVKWWFLVKGSEEDLTKLEGEWPKVKLQTSWKLESCYQPAATERVNAGEKPAQDVVGAAAAAGKQTAEAGEKAEGPQVFPSSNQLNPSEPGSGTMQPSQDTSARSRNVTRSRSPSQGSQTMQQLQPDNTDNGSTEASNSDSFLEEP